MAEGRRIKYDDEDKEIYDFLLSKYPFNKIGITELFAIALVFGMKYAPGKLGKTAVGRVRRSTLDSTNVLSLMMAVAVEKTGSMDVLADDNECFTIAEEYAKTGIQLLDDAFSENKNILDDMEKELLEFYNEHIGDKSV